MQRLHDAYADPVVRCLGVSQDDRAATGEFARRYDVAFPILLDDDGHRVSAAYGLTTVPTLVLVDPDGKVESTSVAFNKREMDALADRMSELSGQVRRPLWQNGEAVPDFKPG